MSIPRILVVDRPTAWLESLCALLGREGLSVRRTGDVAEALAELAAGETAVVLGEIGLAGGELLARASSREGGPPVILLDDFGSADHAVEAVRRGAFDTLPRPVAEEQVLLSVRRALEQAELRRENLRLRQEVRERFQLGGLVSADPRMLEVFRTVEAVADSGVGLLIQGESGTGKTVLARTIHERSSRRDGPFVVVNCGALPATLLESELFGHVRGAFTGAVRDRAGKLEAAHGGTLFLDEIATASPDLQVKLLRAIEEGRFERVGETATREVDVRVIAATNADLAEEVRAGRFRADLYYRIDVVGIRVPPLRERPGDVSLLARRFLERFRARHGRAIEGLEPAALARLCAHPWPGNVRELENTLERAVLLARGPLLAARDLWPGAAQDGAAEEGGDGGSASDGEGPWDELPLGPLKDVLEVPERWLILRALRASGGSRQQAADVLGINRTTLFNKMRKYHLGSFPTKMGPGRERPPGALGKAG